MTEELYIIKSGQRVALDLCTPSGVALVFASNLFADLSKIDCSHSYTFKLPATQNNARAFELVADLRYNSPLYGLRIPCEYWRDGVPIAVPAFLYVSEVNKGAYSAVMTFAVIEGLQAINDNDVSITELGDTTNPETIMYGWMGDRRQYVTKYNTYYAPTGYTNGATQTPSYAAGVVRAEYFAPFAPPVVPVHLLLTKIAARYGLQIDISRAYNYSSWQSDLAQGKTPKFCDIAGIPLVTTQLGEDYAEQQGMEMRTVTGASDETFTFTTRDGQQVVTLQNALQFSSFRYFHQMDFIEFYDTHRPNFIKTKQENVSLQIGGNLVVSFNETAALEEKPHLRVVELGWRGEHEIANIEAEYDEENSTSGDQRYFWDFRETEGFTPYDCEETIETVGAPIGFALDVMPDAFVEGTLVFSPFFAEGVGGHSCRVFECLPDISCFTLLKSLFYVLGGFPKITSGGAIGISYYTELRDNLQAGIVYDWTGYACIDYGADPDTLKYTNGNLAQRNALLMKNESLERQEIGRTDDVYDAPAFALECENGTLEKVKTLHQFPFFGRFIRNGQHHKMATGDTIKYFDMVDNELQANEAQPAIGLFKIDVSPDTQHSTQWLYFDVWQAGDDNEQYNYLQAIIQKPYVVKIPVRVPLPVLVGIDYTRPVYIGQLNAYFAIMSITMDGNGQTTAELIKLP